MCFLRWAMKYTIATDKLSLSSLSFIQISPFSSLCSVRVSAHLPHLPLSQTSLTFLHIISSHTPCSGLHFQVPFFCLNTSHKIPSFSQGDSSIPSTPTSSTSLHCCLLLPRLSSASLQSQRWGSAAPDPASSRSAGSPRHSKAAARLLRKMFRPAPPRARSCRLLQTVGRHKHNPSWRLQPLAPHGRRGGEGRGGGRAGSARPALRGAGGERSTRGPEAPGRGSQTHAGGSGLSGAGPGAGLDHPQDTPWFTDLWSH